MKEFDAIVIGSGMGGLATAAILARLKQWRVLVLERHFRAGGFTHTFKRPGGYEWDVGLHYVGQMAENSRSRKLFDFVTGGHVQWNEMPECYDTFSYPNFTFNVPKGKDKYQRALGAQFPAEATAIARYFKDVQTASSFFERNIIAGAIPSLPASCLRLFNRIGSGLPLKTTRDYMESRFQDPALKALLASQWMDYGLPPSESAFATHALIVSHYFTGGWYPQGGSGTIAEGAQRVIEQAGGEVRVNHQVERVLVEKGRAVGVEVSLTGKSAASTVCYRAPLVISDAGAWNTFRNLVPASVKIPFREELDRFSSAGPLGFTNVTLYLGLNADPRSLGFEGENHWIFQGLDHDSMLDHQDDLLEGRAHICYLSFPSLKNPGARHHTAEIIAPLTYAAVERFRGEPWRRRSDAYQSLKENMSRAMLAAVERQHPGFSEMVAFSELSTPLTAEHFTAHPGGAVYGIPATPQRYRMSWLQPDTPLKGLYLTGTDAGSLGIMGALMGGVCAAARIIGPLGLFSIFKAAFQNQPNPAASNPPVV